jgi:predicted DNA-binding transcriptional regulator AlpA
MTEILTIEELAALLKMTRGQVYTLTRSRSRVRMDHPIPILKINGNVRFRRRDIEGWLELVAKEEGR